MKLSDGVEWALHCCTVLALVPEGSAMPAARLAEFHGVPGAYLAKHLQALARAGIVTSTQGPKGGYRLAKPAAAITLLEVVDAVEGDEPSFRCSEIRRRGPAAVPARGGAYVKPCGIARAMWRADEAWRASLRSETIADLLRGLAVDIDPRSAVKAANWMQEVLT
jgi:Rrf2 family protein